MDDFVRAFPMPASSRGVAIGIFDRLVGLDLFDSAETLERQWARLVASGASALLDHQRAIGRGLAKAQAPPPGFRRAGQDAGACAVGRD